MLSYPDEVALKPATGVIHSKFLERGNVEPASELVQLMDAQRQLEANANMIRYQDQTLSRLVNDVGKIS
jgi:flagellar basal-body rod protein FlgG